MAAITKKLCLYLILLIGLFLLSGCLNNKTPAEEIHLVLENVVSAEKKFEETQGPLVDLEKKEKALYDEILSLGKKKQEQISQLADTALENIKKRKEYMNVEQESMQQSKQEFDKVQPIIEKLESDDLKQRANQLSKLMYNRYKVHDDLYKNYQTGLNNDQILYELFKNKETTLDQIEDQIKKVNKAYENVIKDNEQFNELTKKYNETKLSFYKEANLNIEKK